MRSNTSAKPQMNMSAVAIFEDVEAPDVEDPSEADIVEKRNRITFSAKGECDTVA